MARYDDLNEFKNEREKMNAIRERVSKVIYERIKPEFGEEFVRYIPKDIGITPNASKVAKYTVVADVGDVKDNGGCDVGVCVEITVKVKKWNTVETKSDKITYGITLDDYDIELEEEKEGE
jgi:hypothetical protein